MQFIKRTAYCFLFLFALFALPNVTQPSAADVPPRMYGAMRWRMIGPHRGGRVVAVSGVRGQPETFYFGSVCGGVWKTTDAGQTWTPIFDSQPIASIGALAVAPSDPNIIYVGSGEADMRSDISFGDGMYKSTDAGQTWTHIGLRDTQQIGRVLVDPRDPNVVLVAALGHGFGPNAERGVFRSTDGGKTWTKTLYKDENTGAIDLAYDPENAQTVYAALWNARRPAWSTYAPVSGPGGGLYKSTDGGVTWTELRGHGLPEKQIGRIGLAVCAGGRRIYASIDADPRGLFRSDDAGASWQLVGTDARIIGRAWYFSGVTVDPRNPDVVYISNVSIYRSTDGGRTFQAFRGAPGGDDYHALWIDPDDPQRMISGVDQGTIITVNGGRTWSSWYNQPTAQFYHVAVDNQFPYYVYGAQQDSGTAAVASRSDFGLITFRDWYPIGAGESGYILPDPVDPNIVWGGSTGGELYRFDKRTHQVEDITPTPAAFGAEARNRYPWTAPIAFAPQPPHALYQASQYLFKTTNGGASWQTISPDLTVRRGQADEGKAVIYTIAPSPVQAGQIWIGTDNGLIQLTRDEGRTWRDVSPAGLPDWSMISLIDASHFDAGTAYAAIDRHQMDDHKPYIYRTHDYGQTWTQITNGIPEPAFARVVREDPVRKGLLFAGTELGVYVSFDDGDHWQSLQLNLPVTSIRDLVIHNNDVVVATHGRSFWILDDITPLRQTDAAVVASGVHLFNPAPAYRLRASEGHDTPLQPETPAGQNPPAGAIIDYTLPSAPAGAVTLEILDEHGALVRKFSSSDPVREVRDVQNFPTYWLRPPAPPSKHAGHNRFVWDLRYPQPLALHYGYGIAAFYGADTPQQPEGPLVLPGTYQVRLTVNGHTHTAPLEVKLDPREQVAPATLVQQLDLEMKIGGALAESYNAVRQIESVRQQLKDLRMRVANDPNNRVIDGAAVALDQKLAALVTAPPAQAPPNPTAPPTLPALNDALAALMTVVNAADTAPTAQASAAFTDYRRALDAQLQAWRTVNQGVATLNALLSKQGLPVIRLHDVSAPPN